MASPMFDMSMPGARGGLLLLRGTGDRRQHAACRADDEREAAASCTYLRLRELYKRRSASAWPPAPVDHNARASPPKTRVEGFRVAGAAEVDEDHR